LANVIDIIVKGHDQTSKIFRKIGREADRAFLQAEQSFKRLENEMKSIPDIQIDADTSKARAEITALQTTIALLEDKDIEIDVKANTRLFMRAIAAISPAMVPTLAAGVVAVGGLTAAFAAAGAGVLGFGAVATTVLGKVFEATKDGKLELQGLTKEQQNAAKALRRFKDYWTDFANSFQSPILDIFTQSLLVLTYTIDQMKPAIDGAIRGIQTLLNGVKQFTKTSDFQDFFRFLGNEAETSIVAFGQAAGNVIRGVMSLMMAFAPLAKTMQNGLVGLTKGFADWAASMENDSASFERFVNYAMTNGRTVISLIKDIGAIVGNVLVILAPIGSVILSVLSNAVSGLRTFTDALKNAFSTGNFSAIPLAFITLVNSILQSIISRLPAFIQTGLQMLTSLAQGVVNALPALLAMISNLVTQILQIIVQNLPLILSAGATILLTLIQGIANNLHLMIPIVFALINTVVTIITQNLPLIIALGVSILNRLIDGITQAMPSLINAAIRIILEVINGITRNLPKIIDAGIKIINSLINGITKTLPNLIDAAVKLIIAIIDGISRNLPKIIDAGVKIVVALVQGLSKAIPQIVAALPKIINSIKDGLKKVNWRQVGVDIISAIASGLKSIVLTIPRPKIPKINISAASTSVAGISIPYPKFSVSWFAKGGLFDGPSVVGVGEAGKEAIIPLSGPNMRPFAQTIAKEMDNGSPQGKQQNTTINIYEAQRTTDKEVLNALRKAAFLYG
jgi:phage-related protein